jgi:hypothetical protein
MTIISFVGFAKRLTVYLGLRYLLGWLRLREIARQVKFTGGESRDFYLVPVSLKQVKIRKERKACRKTTKKISK